MGAFDTASAGAAPMTCTTGMVQAAVAPARTSARRLTNGPAGASATESLASTIRSTSTSPPPAPRVFAYRIGVSKASQSDTCEFNKSGDV